MTTLALLLVVTFHIPEILMMVTQLWFPVLSSSGSGIFGCESGYSDLVSTHFLSQVF